MGNEIGSSYDAPRGYSRISPWGHTGLGGGSISAFGGRGDSPLVPQVQAVQDNDATLTTPDTFHGSFGDAYRQAQASLGGGPLWDTTQEYVVTGDAGAGSGDAPAADEAAQADQEIGSSSSGLTSEFGTSSSGLTGDTGQAVNDSAEDAAARGDDYAGAVYNQEGQRVDPVTGEVLDEAMTSASERERGGDYDPNTPGVQGQPGSVGSSNYGSADQAWVDFLRANGYDVVEENGDTQIRGRNGRGESQSYHGHFGDPDDWTDAIKALRGKFDEQQSAKTDQERQGKRVQEVQNILDLLPEAPQLDEAGTRQEIEAARQERAIQQAMALDAAMAGAARGRVGVGAQAGIQAQAGNQASAAAASQAAQIWHQSRMANFDAQRQQYASQISMIERMISGEKDMAAAKMLFEQRKELMRRQAAIEAAARDEQLAMQEREQNFGLLGEIVSAAGNVLGTSV